MDTHDIGELVKVVAVIAMVVTAAALATPPGRVPLALRGIQRILRRDAGVRGGAPATGKQAPLWRRILAFVLVLAALALCYI